MNHSGARFLVVSDYYADAVRRIEAEMPALERVFVIRPTRPAEGKYASFGQLETDGQAWRQAHPGELEERTASVTADDLANISYTSGTTAEPKGIMLSHGNYVSNVLQSDSLIQIPSWYKVLLFLPWDHSFAHTVGIYSFMYNGASLAAVDFGRSPMEYLRNIPVNLKEVKPHILLSVPALAKNFRKNIEAGIHAKGGLVRWLYRQGLRVAYRYYATGNYTGKGFRHLLRPLVWLAEQPGVPQGTGGVRGQPALFYRRRGVAGHGVAALLLRPRHPHVAGLRAVGGVARHQFQPPATVPLRFVRAGGAADGFEDMR